MVLKNTIKLVDVDVLNLWGLFNDEDIKVCDKVCEKG